MGYGDGLAAIVGRSINSYTYSIGKTKKTLAGSGTMLIISFIIISTFFVYLGIGFWYLKALVLSIIITIVEAVSSKGTDNVTVPIVTALLVSCFI